MRYNPDIVRLADLMFPSIKTSIADLEARFPPRQLPLGAEVTRFAPSPTGFLHTGSLFTSLVAKTVAAQSGGVFFVRLEDTDTKREIAGSDMALIEQMALFGVTPDEGFGATPEGAYGPYRQSERAAIYHTVIKQMVLDGHAYPCFATVSELAALRQEQEARKLVTGYYGSFAKYRDYPVKDAIKDIEEGRPFVVRFRSEGDHNHYIDIFDEVRGHKRLSENDEDVIIMKSDGLPTYHFAHVVDDHFMRTTVVSRGEEWLPSLPKHIQMFAALGWTAPRFAHLPVIMKLDGGSRRKLSKRHDSEAAVSFFLEQGYPKEALIEYLMILANSNFEEWRLANKTAPLDSFKLTFDKMAVDGALFDLQKVLYLSKEMIAFMPAAELLARATDYGRVYNQPLYELISRDPGYFKKVINIEREKENPRKDFTTYGSIYDAIQYFYHDRYLGLLDVNQFNPNIRKDTIIETLKTLSLEMSLMPDEAAWFAQLKDIGTRLGFAPSGKIYKQDPAKYRGHIGDVAEILRLALTGQKQTPNLYQIMDVLGNDEVRFRLRFVIEKLV